MDTRQLWQAVLGELEVTLSPAVYRTFLKPTAIIAREGEHMVVAVPNAMTKTQLEKRYNGMIVDILERIGGGIKSIEYRIHAAKTKPKIAENQTQFLEDAPTGIAPARQLSPVAAAKRARSNASRASRLNPKYTLDNFVVGPSNDLAYAAGQGVTGLPGEKYNPLFIYGGVGLGKTHLMHAVGNEIASRNPDAQICYVTSEEFTKEFTDSISRKTTKHFSDKYRPYDVLIVDDIQFLGNKERTQEEFFHTFNTLHQANKQVILSSDKPPKAIPNLEERLKSRFEWGMVADVQKPDLETRTAIIQRKAENSPISLYPDVMEYLAQYHKNNIRELEGSLTKIIAQCELRNVEPSLVFVKQLLGESVTTTRKRPTSPIAVIERTAAYYHVMPSDLTGPRRDKEVVKPRQVAIYLMRHELDLSQPKIAQHMGGRDHTTILHSIKKIEKLLEIDSELRADIEYLQDKVRS